jgi:serine/threonine protein kinase
MSSQTSNISNGTTKKKKVSAKNLGNYILVKNMIGKGAYAEVFEGFRRDENKTPVAIKVIPRSKLNDKLMNSLEQEINIMKGIRHANIIRLYDVHRSKRHFYLVMERCTGGDLAQYLRTEKNPLPEPVAHKFLTDLAFGLNILNKKNLVHRDLKPANLMLSTKSTANELGLLKIADFGFAREIQPNDMAETLCGSPLYMAPEILEGKRYDAKADLWSVGTIMFEMLFGRPPYQATSMADLLRKIKTTTLMYPNGVVSSAAIHLLQGLLQPNPQNRMTFVQFFNHPYLNLKARPDFALRSDMDTESPKQTPVEEKKESGIEPEKNRQEAITQDIQIITIPKTKPFVDPTNQYDNSFVVVPDANALGIKTLDACITMDSSGNISYPNVIFDFTKMTSENMNLVIEIEASCLRAWSIAEAAYLMEHFNRTAEAIALYCRSLDFLFNLITYAQKECSIKKISTSDRLHADLVWLQTQFDYCLERADGLKSKIGIYLNNVNLEAPDPQSYVCAEDILYQYALKLAKQSAYLEWSKNSSDNFQIDMCVNMYRRSMYIFEYLLYHCEFLTNKADRSILESCKYNLLQSFLFVFQFANTIFSRC